MSRQTAPNGSDESSEFRRGRRMNQLLTVIVGLEAAALIAATAVLIIDLMVATPDSFRTAIALTVLTAFAAVWVSATTIATARRARWARGSAITWQILQIAVAFGAIQGENPKWGFAFALAVPAVAAFSLAVSRPVRAVFGVDETPAR